MGLIASVFAYLITATALVIALLMSLGAFLYPSSQTTLGQQTIAATAKPSVTQSASMPSASNARQASPAVAEAAADGPHAGSENTASPRPRVHRLARQVRMGNWLFQRKPSALGYAEEPSASFLYDRFQ
jgi:predicted lipid-binding transport protein (Tim44 family)